ncbi:MAG: hypothetical protein LBE13_08995 [Bacteroidales bacterium]|jgi:hypothetical protein|nr:hypothetical protein [Bacteroidales bacterium]
MKTVILIISMCSINFLLSCCNKLFPDEKLSIQREDYTGNELRTDGYYYLQEKDYERTIVMFLYRNGIILSGRIYFTLDLNVVEKEMVSKYNELGNEKPYWGVFTITNNNFEYEQWVAPTEGISVSKNTGYIENNTTFHITEKFFSYNKTKYSVNEIWHFKQFANKPDSTNVYIK